MHRTSTFAALLAVLFLTGCGRGTELETRTFALAHLQPHEAAALVEPYVFDDREGAPGTMSGTAGALTVRETPDNLDRIARVLAEFDVPRPDIRLHFQLVEADGFTGSDPRIADVEEQLRQVFQFRGYRLVGEAMVSATDGSRIEQGLGADHAVAGHVYFTGPGIVRLEEVELYSYEGGDRLTTTVNVRPGQTLVLGSATKVGDDVTLLLTVRAEATGP